MIIIAGFVLFFTLMAWWGTLRQLGALEEHVDDAVKTYNKRFKQLEDDLTDLERGGNPGYRDNANAEDESHKEECEESESKPPKPFVYGQEVYVLLSDDGYEVDSLNRPWFSAMFYGFSKVGNTTMVMLQVGDLKVEGFQLSEIEMKHPEVP